MTQTDPQVRRCIDCDEPLVRNGDRGPWPIRCPPHREEALRRTAQRARDRAPEPATKTSAKTAAVSWGTSTGDDAALLAALAQHWRMPVADTVAELKRRALLAVSGYPQVKTILADRARDEAAKARRAEFRSV